MTRPSRASLSWLMPCVLGATLMSLGCRTGPGTVPPPPGTAAPHGSTAPVASVCPGTPYPQPRPTPMAPVPDTFQLSFYVEETPETVESSSRLVLHLKDTPGDPCLTDFSATVSVHGRRFVVTPRTAPKQPSSKPVPCPAVVPDGVSTSVALPADLEGVYELELHRGQQRDRYQLEVSRQHVAITAREARFSAFLSPSPLARVAPGTLQVNCREVTWTPSCGQPTPGAPTCADFYAQPALRALSPAPIPPGPYVSLRFGHPEGCFLQGTLEEAARVRQLALDWSNANESRCLLITVR